jgi:hypothetical protein
LDTPLRTDVLAFAAAVTILRMGQERVLFPQDDSSLLARLYAGAAANAKLVLELRQGPRIVQHVHLNQGLTKLIAFLEIL